MTLQASLESLLIEGIAPSGDDDRLPWRDWLAATFPDAASAPMPEGGRHARLWEWFEALRPGIAPRARIEGWPRGGGKSSSAELACIRLSQTLTRRFVLYVCGTQTQADQHVRTIGIWMERAGIRREVSMYGQARGWSRRELHASGGFTIAAYGLDTAARGIKVQEYRPDLIILDDVDAQDDSPYETTSKIEAITLSILPTGSADCAVLFVQNKIHANSILAQLADGRADFLRDRDVFQPEPAVIGLEYETYTDVEGRALYRIKAGTPTWEGQPLSACELLMNRIGEHAFLREAQHQVGTDTRFAYFEGAIAYLQERIDLYTSIRVQDEQAKRAPHYCKNTIKAHAGQLTINVEVYRDAKIGHRYVIGADVAKGIARDAAKVEDRDYCTIDVYDIDTWEHMAEGWGREGTDPELFAGDLAAMGYTYNKALIIVESNKDGRSTLNELVNHHRYPNAYFRKLNRINAQGMRVEDTEWGFETTQVTKPIADNYLKSLLVDAANGGKFEVRGLRGLQELVNYGHLPGGRAGALTGHDDLVRSKALVAVVLRETPPVSVRNLKPKEMEAVYGNGGEW